jgi:hypothetical protein
VFFYVTSRGPWPPSLFHTGDHSVFSRRVRNEPLRQPMHWSKAPLDCGEVSDRLEGIKKRGAKASSGAGAGAQLSVEGQNGEGLTGVNRLAQRIVWLPNPLAELTTSPRVTVRLKPSGKTAARRPTRAVLRVQRAAQVARWRRLLDEGVYLSRAALARAEGVSRAAVTQTPKRPQGYPYGDMLKPTTLPPARPWPTSTLGNPAGSSGGASSAPLASAGWNAS